MKKSNAYLWMLVMLTLGLCAGDYLHPYEVCKRMYDTPEDVSECVWLRQNR